MDGGGEGEVEKGGNEEEIKAARSEATSKRGLAYRGIKGAAHYARRLRPPSPKSDNLLPCPLLQLSGVSTRYDTVGEEHHVPVHRG